MNIEIPQSRYNNRTREKRSARYNLKNDKNIVIKRAGKDSAVVVWDRDDYIKETKNQLGEKDIEEEVRNDPEFLLNTIHKAKIWKRGGPNADTILCFMFVSFYLLPKIHKRLHDAPGRPVISNCGYYRENIPSFLDIHYIPLSREVQSFIKDTNDFLRKLHSLPNLPDDILFCTVEVAGGSYPNIPHGKSLSALLKPVDLIQEKDVTISTPAELAEVVFKKNIFTFNKKTLK